MLTQDTTFMVRPIGVVRSPLKGRDECPKQGHEGGVEAWVEIDPALAEALDGLSVGCEVILITWFHEAERDVLKVHPRGNPDNPRRGVFSTRSPDRPNPIGLHRVKILEMAGTKRLLVYPLEALDGTPVIDIKSVMKEVNDC